MDVNINKIIISLIKKGVITPDMSEQQINEIVEKEIINDKRKGFFWKARELGYMDAEKIKEESKRLLNIDSFSTITREEIDWLWDWLSLVERKRAILAKKN